MSSILLLILLAASSVAEDLQTGIVHNASKFTYIPRGGDTGVEITSSVPRSGRGIKFDGACTCGVPKLPAMSSFSHCWNNTFPASVTQCECLRCRLSVNLWCSCNDQRWYPEDQILCDPAVGPKKCGICSSLPEHTAYHESRYQVRHPDDKIKLQGYFGEKIMLRCKSSCREVNAVCSYTTGFWRYRSTETPCTENESHYEGVIEEDGLTFKLGERRRFSFSCPAGKLLDSSEVIQCRDGILSAKFPTCINADEVEFNNTVVHEAPETSTMKTEVTTLTSEVTDLGDVPPQPIPKLGILDYILVAVIVTFIFILIGLWTWIIKDKRREAMRKRLLAVKQATAKQYVL